MPTDWKSRADTIERSIREGRIGEAKTALEKLDGRLVPRPLLARYAELARRAGLPTEALRWLRPCVRPSERRPANASEAERLEYAASLIRLGAVDEAGTLLDTLDSDTFPRTGFERAAALVAEWKYAESIPVLEAYLRHRSLSAYERSVGRLNLAAALLYEEESKRATPMIRRLLHDASVRRNGLLLGRTYLLGAQSFIAHRQFREAERLLDEAERRLVDAVSLDRFFIRKWRAFIAFRRRPADGEKRIVEVRDEAEKLGHWETCRDCDRLLGVHRNDRALLLKVYFGTPYERFRSRLLRELRGEFAVPKDFLWTAAGKRPAHCIDLAEPSPALGEAPVLHRALPILTSDFYRPLRVAPFFQRLHPGEHFHPATSANRMHQQFRALRRWLEEHAPGIALRESNAEYRLVPSTSWGIRVPLAKEFLASDLESLRLRKLEEIYGRSAFDASDAAARLGIAPRTVLRVLTTGMERGRLVRSGKRARARYRFTSKTEGDGSPGTVAH